MVRKYIVERIQDDRGGLVHRKDASEDETDCWNLSAITNTHLFCQQTKVRFLWNLIRQERRCLTLRYLVTESRKVPFLPNLGYLAPRYPRHNNPMRANLLVGRGPVHELTSLDCMPFVAKDRLVTFDDFVIYAEMLVGKRSEECCGKFFDFLDSASG